MKPDVIVTWPTGMDYPLWRYMMTEHRKKFGQIYIVFDQKGRPDFRKFLYRAFKNAFFINMPDSGYYWRHNAINLALSFSKSEWVWFTEMDFFFKEDYGFVKMFEQAESCDGVVWDVGERYHPACCLLKRETVEKTDCYFDPAYYDKKPGEEGLTALLDHFTAFTWQLNQAGKFKTLKEIGLKEGEDFYHMSDLTHNYDRVKVGNVEEQHFARDFLIYNAISRHAPVPQCKEWLEITYVAEYLLSPFGRFINR